MVTWRTYKEAFRELTKATNAVLFRIVEDSADEFSEAFPAPWTKEMPELESKRFLDRLWI